MRIIILLCLSMCSNIIFANPMIDKYILERDKSIQSLYDKCEIEFKKHNHWGKKNICRRKARESMPERHSDEYRYEIYGDLTVQQANDEINKLKIKANKARVFHYQIKLEAGEMTNIDYLKDIEFIRYKILKQNPKDFEYKKAY